MQLFAYLTATATGDPISHSLCIMSIYYILSTASVNLSLSPKQTVTERLLDMSMQGIIDLPWGMFHP